MFTQKILIFNPAGSRSQVIWNARIADTLAEAGMDVLLVEAEFGVRTSGMQTVKSARRLVLTGFNVSIFGEFASDLTIHTFDKRRWPLDMYSAYWKFLKGHNFQCEELLKQNDVLETLKKEKFDIIISDMLHLCGAGLKEVLGIKTHVWLNRQGYCQSICAILDHVSWVLGMPLEHSYVPAVGDLDVSDDMSYFERMRNTIESIGNTHLFLRSNEETTKLFRRFYGADFPDLTDIARESAHLLVAVEELVDFPRPVLPNVVYIGGVGMNTTSAVLPKDLEAELSKGSNGAVFLSLGTNTDTARMPLTFLQNMFQVFDKFPAYHFIVKADKGDEVSLALASNRSNVFLTSWAPQNDLLGHARVKAFVSHGGYNSLLESARNGVPILAMPFFADQYRNARLAQRNGWGIAFDKRQLLHGSDEFVEALARLLTDRSYSANATRIQHLLKTKPFSPEERLVRSMRFVAENGGHLPELQSRSRHLSFFVYGQIDVLLTLFGIGFTMLALFVL
ncbi:CRE-UGT-48 protein, partial [Aphelenchoides avenae]